MRSGFAARDRDLTAALAPPSRTSRGRGRTSTLFFLNRYRMPSLFCLTTLSLRASIFATSMRQALDLDAVVGEVRARRARSSRTTAAAPSTGCSRRWCRCRPAPGRPSSFFQSSMQAVCEAELRGADRGDVAAGAAADDDDVEVVRPSPWHQMSSSRRAGSSSASFIATRQHRFAAVDDAVVVGHARGSSSAGPRSGRSRPPRGPWSRARRGSPTAAG